MDVFPFSLKKKVFLKTNLWNFFQDDNIFSKFLASLTANIKAAPPPAVIPIHEKTVRPAYLVYSLCLKFTCIIFAKIAAVIMPWTPPTNTVFLDAILGSLRFGFCQKQSSTSQGTTSTSFFFPLFDFMIIIWRPVFRSSLEEFTSSFTIFDSLRTM